MLRLAPDENRALRAGAGETPIGTYRARDRGPFTSATEVGAEWRINPDEIDRDFGGETTVTLILRPGEMEAIAILARDAELRVREITRRLLRNELERRGFEIQGR